MLTPPTLPPGRWEQKITKTGFGIGFIALGLFCLAQSMPAYIWLSLVILGSLVADSEVVAAPFQLVMSQAIALVKALRGN